ncbi:Multidrug efflux pump subunit AcrA (membrane-fusion protein) [Tenacibaculum sp. MAR_2009_124]|uniref:efflux RND transporter periplasmic adaptor subunit n=1 Tax=Tenacibaculum sp. MAR_2009_124 TaxID=1250059 RepID=UPI00089713DD|nr:HlyD family efflux transporter periplasmic adaptor subunit [Tenacibaculum sp. MAR_2009_124]SEB46882.1 Multidrug efflux pump subunit AcrA (membrane-fusion protein) [Tenacibaculum sp. MAR_2009_124]
MKHNNKLYLVATILTLSLFISCNKKETTKPIRKNIENAVFASGHIEQENQYTVSASVEGILTSIPVSEGDFIMKNTTVASIKSDVQKNQVKDALIVYNNAVNNAASNSSTLQQIEVKINQARSQLILDESNYERYKNLLEKNSVSQLEYEKAYIQYQASKNNLLGLKDNYKQTIKDLKVSKTRSLVQVNTQKELLEDYHLKSSISGTVIDVFKKQGELIRRGEAVAEIGSGDFIIKLFVAEDDIRKINLGQLVAVHVNTNTEETFTAEISKIYPGFNIQEQSYIVEAKFKQGPKKIFSGSQLQANIKTKNVTNVLVIPTEYLIKENHVLLDNGEEKAIEIGHKNIDWTVVKSGISESTKIVKPKK